MQLLAVADEIRDEVAESVKKAESDSFSIT